MSMRDAKINSRAKGILVRRAVDLRYVNFSTIKGIVYINGWLVYERSLRPLSSLEIFNIEREIKRIPDVEGVNFKVSSMYRNFLFNVL